MPKNGTLRKKKRMKARRGLDRATGVADEGGNGTRPPRTALARGPTFADAPPIPRGAAGTKRPAADDDAPSDGGGGGDGGAVGGGGGAVGGGGWPRSKLSTTTEVRTARAARRSREPSHTPNERDRTLTGRRVRVYVIEHRGTLPGARTRRRCTR